VIDFPINGANTSEYYVVWGDRNESINTVNGAIVETPAITGTVVTYDCSENPQSGPALSLYNQLNIVNFSNGQDTAEGDVEAGLGNTRACGANGPGGFVRWFAQPNPNNVGGLTAAAYQAGVIFRLRQSGLDGYSQFPVDRGFFTAK
jgi:hypothetical protein